MSGAAVAKHAHEPLIMTLRPRWHRLAPHAAIKAAARRRNRSWADVLEAVGMALPERTRPQIGSAALGLLDRLPATIDELVRASGLAAGAVAAALAELEIAQLAAEGDGIYRALRTRSTSAVARCCKKGLSR